MTGKGEPKIQASLFRTAIESIEEIRTTFNVRVTMRFEWQGGNSRVWIVRAMGKEFMKRDFPGAVAKMCEFVLKAHNIKV